jgi:hypothetical protein
MEQNLSQKILDLLKYLEEVGYYTAFMPNTTCKKRFIQWEGQHKFEMFSCASCREGRKIVSEVLGEKCPLCNLTLKNLPQPLTKLKWIKFETRFLIIPNAFPYLPNHVNLITKNHESQEIIRHMDTINSLFHFHHQLELKDHKWMLFFNHLIGNSQNHFHVHACKLTPFPLTKLILENAKIFKEQKISIYNFNACFNGLIIYKPNQFIIHYLISHLFFDEFLNFCWFEKYFVLMIRKRGNKLSDSLGSTELTGLILKCDTKTIDLLIESCNVGFVSAERLNELRTITKTHFKI